MGSDKHYNSAVGSISNLKYRKGKGPLPINPSDFTHGAPITVFKGYNLGVVDTLTRFKMSLDVKPLGTVSGNKLIKFEFKIWILEILIFKIEY